ncbi:MAG: tetraacyldisaccharide 4'-kinase, partial [Thermodesulfobacteriota bacterium]
MNPLRRKVEGIISGRDSDPLLSRLLGFFSVLYGGILELRARGYRRGILKSRRLSCRVISVGNITAGGAGKTPMTIYLSRALQRSGYRVAVVSRGYGGRAQKTGGIVSEPGRIRMGPETAGDEPFMMAQTLGKTPVLVGGDRYRSGITALKRFQPEIILLDDGFQHLKLKRDLDLVLLDCRRPVGNGRVLPRGPLREPLTALKRADAFVLTRCAGTAPDREDVPPFLPLGKPIFRSVHRPYVHGVFKTGQIGEAGSFEGAESEKLVTEPDPDRLLQGRRVFAFSGIADHHSFLHTVHEYGGIPAGHLEFSDHHPYSAQDLARIARSARESGAEWIVTTEKDFVRLPENTPWPLNLAVI